MSQEQCQRDVSVARRSSRLFAKDNNRHLLVPVGESHHDVEGGQKKGEVEEGVAVGDSLLFIVHGPSDSVLPYWGLCDGQTLSFLGLHQPVHLGVVGGADTVASKSTTRHCDA